MTTSSRLPDFMCQQIRRLLFLGKILAATSLPAMGEDHSSGWLPYEESVMKPASQPPPTAEHLAQLPLDSPILRLAYAHLSLDQRGAERHDGSASPEVDAAMTDLQRRGDAATPLLLDLMAKNQNTALEDLTPRLAARAKSIAMEPYIEYLRALVRDRADEISAAAAECATILFIEHGTPEDIETMKKLAMKRPYLEYSVNNVLRAFQPRFAAKETPKPESSTSPTPRPAPLSGRPVQSTPQAKNPPATPKSWLAECLGAAGLVCLGFWFWRHRKQRA